MSDTKPERGFRQRLRRRFHFESSKQRSLPPTTSRLASPVGKIASPQNPLTPALPTSQLHVSPSNSGSPPVNQPSTATATQSQKAASAAVLVLNPSQCYFAHESIESTIKAAEDAQRDVKEKRWSCHDKIDFEGSREVALNRFEAVESLETAMETILTKMAACEFYASLYAESLQENLGSALPEFYAAVLVFSVKAKGYFAPPTTTGRLNVLQIKGY
ncbi:hypothetical protein BDD12DRAFT_801858 [Trichophaea hybrida]|nr:hypothetical protein BDD12DRAFT_801858 [Trichophaea hybrida]